MGTFSPLNTIQINEEGVLVRLHRWMLSFTVASFGQFSKIEIDIADDEGVPGAPAQLMTGMPFGHMPGVPFMPAMAAPQMVNPPSSFRVVPLLKWPSTACINQYPLHVCSMLKLEPILPVLRLCWKVCFPIASRGIFRHYQVR